MATPSIPSYTRPILDRLIGRLREPRRFIQVLTGPRQTGKTTLARQALATLDVPFRYASADSPTLEGPVWIEQQWELARRETGEAGGILVLDEVQKVSRWSEAVKGLWDEDMRTGVPLHVVLLGSAPLLMQSGLTESLAGRFETIPVTHWSFSEMREAFGWPLEKYVFYGGYPGAAPLTDDEDRWRAYVLESLIETTISRDILLMTRVHKPALLRRLFELACAYSGQILSFQKMLGQLHDAGNTTTLAHYLELLEGAGMVAGLQKFAGQQVRRRASSPKLQVLNTGLMTALSGITYQEALEDRDFWGRVVESAVGAHLKNSSTGSPLEVFYWRDRGREVDFVLKSGSRIAALEVKSGRNTGSLPGMAAFDQAFSPSKKLLVGGDGIPVDEFLSQSPEAWMKG